MLERVWRKGNPLTLLVGTQTSTATMENSVEIPWKKVKVKVAQSCLTLCEPMDYTVRGIFQARILELIAFPFSRGSSQPRDWTQVSHTAGGFFTSWATREAQLEIQLPYDPAIPLLGIHTEETRIKRDRCTPMFIAALFTIASTWKQPRCPSADEWIRKLWYIYTMEYYSAVKSNTFESVLMRWIKLEPLYREK